MKLVRLLHGARTDIGHVRHYYNTVSPALGDGFMLHVEHAIQRVSIHPELYQIAFDDIRRIPLTRFPYQIAYRILPSHIEIISVMHMHRDPFTA